LIAKQLYKEFRMLVITPELRKHMVEKFSVAADASDEDIRKSVGDKIVAGELSLDTVKELTTPKASESEAKVASMIEASVQKALAGLNLGNSQTQQPATPSAGNAPAGTGAKAYGSAAGSNDAGSFNASYDQVRVKSVVEQFTHNPTTATWDKSDNQFLAKSFGGRDCAAFVEGLPYNLDMPTERSKAIAGAWMKHLAIRSMGGNVPSHLKLTELDRNLINFAANECKFTGEVGGVEYTGEKLTNPLHIKAVLDDSTSGGLEAVPIEFDAAIILTPLLTGELYPLVSQTVVTRRRIEAAKIGNPTMTWGTDSGTAIGLFDTDAFISAFDNTIHTVSGAMEIGIDFLADSPVAVGQVIVQRYGQVFLKEMDYVIAMGDGTSQPEGLFTASGTATVTPSSAGNAPTVGDYEGLMFGVNKAFRQEAGMPPNSRAVFLGNDTSYMRARGIPVDSSNDARRIFGIENEMDYRLFNYRYAIQNSLSNVKYGYFCLNRYRLYRRQGLEVQVVSGTDWTLARQNKQGIVVRGRFGGALDHSGAGAKITAGQT
jgi:HK97 family phage major capsid protein